MTIKRCILAVYLRKKNYQCDQRKRSLYQMSVEAFLLLLYNSLDMEAYQPQKSCILDTTLTWKNHIKPSYLMAILKSNTFCYVCCIFQHMQLFRHIVFTICFLIYLQVPRTISIHNG